MGADDNHEADGGLQHDFRESYELAGGDRVVLVAPCSIREGTSSTRCARLRQPSPASPASPWRYAPNADIIHCPRHAVQSARRKRGSATTATRGRRTEWGSRRAAGERTVPWFSDQAFSGVEGAGYARRNVGSWNMKVGTAPDFKGL